MHFTHTASLIICLCTTISQAVKDPHSLKLVDLDEKVLMLVFITDTHLIYKCTKL